MAEARVPSSELRSEPAANSLSRANGWQDRTVASVLHTVFVLIVICGWSYLGVVRAGRLRASASPNRLALYISTMVFEWVLFAIIYIGVRMHGRSMSEVFGSRWRNFVDFWRDVGIALIFWVVAVCILALAARALRIPRDMQNGLLYMLPRGPAEMISWVLLSITAGICEETIFRGYLQRQFTAWTRSAVLGIILAAAFFGAGHSYQGGRLPILIGIFGLMFGILAEMRRSIKPGMLTHALQDSVTGIVVSVASRLH